MYKTGEIYSVMEEFEKVITGRKDREENKDIWKLGSYYQNGEVNEKFKMYLLGYSAGKTTERLGLY